MEDPFSSSIIRTLCPGFCPGPVNLMPFPVGPMNSFEGSHPIYLNLWFNPEEKREADEVC